MKRFWFAFLHNKNIKVEVFTALGTIALIAATVFLQLKPWITFLVSTAIIIIFLIIILYFHNKEKGFYYEPLINTRDKDNWIGKGVFEYDRKNSSFIITNSSSGYIYENCIMWSNYEFSFKFKILKSNIGVLLRAINLSNYVMLQINQNGIRPHIRVNGGWKVWEFNKVGLEFNSKLSLDLWYECRILCDKRSLKIDIYKDKKKEFEREWDIPEGNVRFEFVHNYVKTYSSFPINLEYGTIGFRNWGSEKALVKDIIIRKI